MKKQKTILSLLIAMAVVAAVTCFPVAASNSTFAEQHSVFINFIEDFYTDTGSMYHFTGRDNENITGSFMSNTVTFAGNKDWESVYDYYVKNVSEAVRTEYLRAKGMDLAKTQTKLAIGTVKGASGGVNPPGFGCDVAYTLSGTLFYDNNTFAVNESQTKNSAKILNMSFSHGIFRTSSTAVSVGNYSATFTSSVTGQIGDWNPTIFEPLTETLTITAD